MDGRGELSCLPRVLLGKVGKVAEWAKWAKILNYILIKKTVLVVGSLLIYFLCARLYIGVLSASI